MGLALAGTAVLEVGPVLLGGDASVGSVLGSINQGDVWCLGTAVGFGLMFARMEHHMEKHAEVRKRLLISPIPFGFGFRLGFGLGFVP